MDPVDTTTAQMEPTTTRVRAGLYVHTNQHGVTVEIESAWDGRGWHVYDRDAEGFRGEWRQHYPTKWQAIEALDGAVE